METTATEEDPNATKECLSQEEASQLNELLIEYHEAFSLEEENEERQTLLSLGLI